MNAKEGIAVMNIKPPFFEIGPKAYLYGDQVLSLALAADAASVKYGVDVIFTTPYTEIRRVAEAAKHLFVCAPHMDALRPGRGLADVLPEALRAAGAKGVMLNHAERPLTMETLEKTLARAREVGLFTIVCANTTAQAMEIAKLGPDIIVAEPSELIGTGRPSSMEYVRASIDAVKRVNPDILVLQGAGISGTRDVYNVISAGAEATGASSAIALAASPEAMADEMLAAVRRAWDARADADRGAHA